MTLTFTHIVSWKYSIFLKLGRDHKNNVGKPSFYRKTKTKTKNPDAYINRIV